MGIARLMAALRRGAVRVVATEGDRAEIAFSGEITADLALRIEEVFLEQAEQGAREWDLDLRQVSRIDATCAFALMRPTLLLAPEPATVRVLGAAAEVRHVLHETGADRVLTFVETPAD